MYQARWVFLSLIGVLFFWPDARCQLQHCWNRHPGKSF